MNEQIHEWMYGWRKRGNNKRGLRLLLLPSLADFPRHVDRLHNLHGGDATLGEVAGDEGYQSQHEHHRPRRRGGGGGSRGHSDAGGAGSGPGPGPGPPSRRCRHETRVLLVRAYTY